MIATFIVDCYAQLLARHHGCVLGAVRFTPRFIIQETTSGPVVFSRVEIRAFGTSLLGRLCLVRDGFRQLAAR